MTPKNYWLGLAGISLLFFTQIHAQVITNIKSTIQGKEVLITYDLQGLSSDAICEVTFYFGGRAEQTNKLANASGDFGENIKIGNKKTIRISNLNPFLPYKTELTFKAKATYTFIPITYFSSLSGAKYKIRSTIPLSWTGGIKESPLSISLFKNNELISKQSNLLNNNNFMFVLPKAAKKGSAYEIRLKDAGGFTMNTGKFRLKPKMHGAVKVVISVAVIGAAGYGVYMLTQDEGETPVTSPEATDVPELPVNAHPGE
jgi:hypothetical protein